MARAPKFNPKKSLDEVKYLASLGLTEKQICTKLNVDYDIFRYHRQTCPELEAALQSGLNETIMSATIQLQRLINSGDFKAIKFFLEKKGGWTDQIQEQQVARPSIAEFSLKLITSKEEI